MKQSYDEILNGKGLLELQQAHENNNPSCTKSQQGPHQWGNTTHHPFCCYFGNSFPCARSILFLFRFLAIDDDIPNSHSTLRCNGCVSFILEIWGKMNLDIRKRSPSVPYSTQCCLMFQNNLPTSNRAAPGRIQTRGKQQWHHDGSRQLVIPVSSNSQR